MARPLTSWLQNQPFESPTPHLDARDAIHGLRQGRGTTESGKRREIGKRSIEDFCKTYLANHFDKPGGEHHRDLYDTIDATSPSNGKRVVRVEPREHGKTTVISLALPLYHLAYQTRWFILLVGEGGAVAQSNLATITDELENNELLLQDFPHLIPKRDSKGQNEKWTDSQIVVSSGATVWAKGLGARMRGLKKGKNRPDLGIVDDPESPETSASFITRIRHRKWFGGTFLGLGKRGWDVYVISNLPHHDCLVAHLLRSKMWDGKLFRAINIPARKEERYPIGNTKRDSSALWPEVWPLERLEAYKKDPTVGELGFAREMMGDPRDEKDNPFDTKTFTTFDWIGPVMLKNYHRFTIFADPAGGEKPGEARKGRKDWACFVLGGRHKTEGFIDIFDIAMTRKPLDRQCIMLVDFYAAWTKLVSGIAIGVEENIAHNLIGPNIVRIGRERSLYPRVTTVQQMMNKMQRILRSQPLIAAGVVRWRRDLLSNPKCAEYFSQYDDYPGDHDDGPDATEGLIASIESNVSYGMPSGDSKESYWKGRVA